METRARQILEAILVAYVETRQPVGSRTLSKVLPKRLSSATIRNVMADLTLAGYLSQPHVSAGRVPTEKAFRHLVDRQMGLADTPNDAERALPEPPREIQQYIATALTQHAAASLSARLEQLTRILSDLTHLVSIAATPLLARARLQRVALLKIDAQQLYVVLITCSKMIYQKLLPVSEDYAQDFLDALSETLNERFSGQTLHDVRAHLLAHLLEEKHRYDDLLAQAVRLGRKALDFEDEFQLHVEGQHHLLEAFECRSELSDLLQALEEKIELALWLKERLHESERVNVHIGREHGLRALHGCAVIAASYGNGQQALGALGVIGPTRMDYASVLPIVDYSAAALSESLQGGSPEA